MVIGFGTGSRIVVSLLTCASVLVLAQAAHAQTVAQGAQSATVATGEDQSAQVGDIVVTAQKRAQALSDVGISISAVDGDALRERGVVSVSQLADEVPTLAIAEPNGPGNQPAIFLRGVGLNDFNSNNNGPIAVYADEVYRSSLVATNFVLFDVERIEVVKGPQGTLFGRNATGGALRVIARKPGRELGVEASASYAEFDTTRFDAALNLPLGDKAAIRVAGIKTDSDGFVRNVFDGSRQAGYDYGSWRAQLRLDPTERLSVLIGVEGAHVRNGGAGYTFQGLLAADGQRCGSADVLAKRCGNALGYTGEPGFYEQSTNTPGYTDRDSYLASAVVSYDLGAVTITSVTGYEDVVSEKFEDTDSSPVELLQVLFGVKSQTFSQELRATYEADRTNATFGVFYLTEDLDQNQTADIFRVLRPTVQGIDPVRFPGGFDPSGAAAGAPILFARWINDQDTRTAAAFGQVEQSVTDTLRLVGGLRYTWEKRDFTTEVRFEEPSFTAPLYDRRLRVESNNVTFKGGLEYRPNSDLLAYATVSSGFKSGGFNGGFLLDERQAVPFDDEKLLAYEVGAKLTIPEANLQFNGAAFYYDYSDIQVFTFVNSGLVPVNILSNAGDARIYGFEGDATWRPARGLTLNAGVGYLNTEFTEFRSNAVLGSDDFTGNRLPLAPELSANAGFVYEAPLSQTLSMTLQSDVAYQSKVFFDPSNDPLLGQDDYVLVNASVGIGHPDGKWRVTAFGRNVTDKQYLSYAIPFASFGYNQRNVGIPRQLGVRLDVRF